MSKSKSKSKSKQATFPDQYWSPNFEIYTHFRGLFEHGKELLTVAVAAPPQEGDEIPRKSKMCSQIRSSSTKTSTNGNSAEKRSSGR